jgi:hypothetical protein
MDNSTALGMVVFGGLILVGSLFSGETAVVVVSAISVAIGLYNLETDKKQKEK